MWFCFKHGQANSGAEDRGQSTDLVLRAVPSVPTPTDCTAQGSGPAPSPPSSEAMPMVVL